MELNIRPLKYEERKYTYAQSQQLRGQTGSIGRLRGDFDSGGFGFYTTWEDHCKSLKTLELIAELDDVVNELRSDNYGLLKNRYAMASYVEEQPESTMKGSYTKEYGFRVDTEKYSYLLRCNPSKGDYNFYVFCYEKEWLDRHMENARSDIRFIDSHYKDLFRLPDGDSVRITLASGEKADRPCRYIDQTHVEVGSNLYHICEFAERMEAMGNTYKPRETPLPPCSYSLLPSTGEVIKIERFEKGYIPLSIQPPAEERKDRVERLNHAAGVSKAQAEAMLAGSMFGWDCPAAKPDRYDENGRPKKAKEQER